MCIFVLPLPGGQGYKKLSTQREHVSVSFSWGCLIIGFKKLGPINSIDGIPFSIFSMVHFWVSWKKHHGTNGGWVFFFQNPCACMAWRNLIDIISYQPERLDLTPWCLTPPRSQVTVPRRVKLVIQLTGHLGRKAHGSERTIHQEVGEYPPGN